MLINLLLLHLSCRWYILYYFKLNKMDKEKTLEDAVLIIAEARRLMNKAMKIIKPEMESENSGYDMVLLRQKVSPEFLEFWDKEDNYYQAVKDKVFNYREKYSEFIDCYSLAYISHKRFFIWTRLLFSAHGFEIRTEGRGVRRMAFLLPK